MRTSGLGNTVIVATPKSIGLQLYWSLTCTLTPAVIGAAGYLKVDAVTPVTFSFCTRTLLLPTAIGVLPKLPPTTGSNVTVYWPPPPESPVTSTIASFSQVAVVVTDTIPCIVVSFLTSTSLLPHTQPAASENST